MPLGAGDEAPPGDKWHRIPILPRNKRYSTLPEASNYNIQTLPKGLHKVTGCGHCREPGAALPAWGAPVDTSLLIIGPDYVPRQPHMLGGHALQQRGRAGGAQSTGGCRSQRRWARSLHRSCLLAVTQPVSPSPVHCSPSPLLRSLTLPGGSSPGSLHRQPGFPPASRPVRRHRPPATGAPHAASPHLHPPFC